MRHRETDGSGARGGRWWRGTAVLVVAVAMAVPAILTLDLAAPGINQRGAVWSTDSGVTVGIDLTSVVAPTTVGGGWVVTFAAVVSGGSGPYDCSWSTGDGGVGSTCVSFTHTFDTAGIFNIGVTACDSNNACSSAGTQSSTQLCNIIDGCNWFVICRSFGGSIISCVNPIHPCGVMGWDTTLTSNNPVTWENYENGVTVGSGTTWSASVNSPGLVTFSSTMTDSMSNQYTSSGVMNFS